jgi:hypothetical protein
MSHADDNSTFPGVEKLMSPEEFSAAGLERLTPAQREALNQWLIRYTAWEAPALRKSNEAVKQVEDAFELRAAIKQPFKGWEGKTRFYLDNGQVWQQRTSGRYYYKGEDTSVRISKNFLGFYVMELLANGRSVGVKKLQ